MEKRPILLILALLVGGVGLYIIWGVYKANQEYIRKLLAENKAVNVVVARKDIPKNTRITRDMLAMAAIPRKNLPDDYLLDGTSVIGAVAKETILRRQVVRKRYLTSGPFGQLSNKLNRGMVAFTIPVDRISSVEGLIYPEDHVDIMATLSYSPYEGQKDTIVSTILENVRVLAVNKNIYPYMSVKSANTVTLELSPEDARMLAYAMGVSKIRLVLRAKADVRKSFTIPSFKGDDFRMKLSLYRPLPPPKKSKVDVFKGTKLEEVAVED